MTGTPKPAHRHTETCPAPTVKDSPSVRLCAGLHSQHWVKHELGGRGGNTIWISQTRLVAGEKTEQTDVIGTSYMHPIEGVDTETWQTQQLWFSSPTINSSFLKSLRCTVISWIWDLLANAVKELALDWPITAFRQQPDRSQPVTTWHDDKSQPVRTWHNLTEPGMMEGRLHSHCSHKSPETARLSTHQTYVQIVMWCMCSTCNSSMSVFLLHSKTMQPLT